MKSYLSECIKCKPADMPCQISVECKRQRREERKIKEVKEIVVMLKDICCATCKKFLTCKTRIAVYCPAEDFKSVGTRCDLWEKK